MHLTAIIVSITISIILKLIEGEEIIRSYFLELQEDLCFSPFETFEILEHFSLTSVFNSELIPISFDLFSQYSQY